MHLSIKLNLSINLLHKATVSNYALGTSPAPPALTPSTPRAPATTATGANVTIAWAAPDDNGDAIQGYVI
jgi:hypothetical protein